MSNILSKSKKTILLFLFVNFIVLAKAQYPVQIIPQLVSPYTLNLSDYYTGTTPKMYVTLTNRDMQRPVAYVRLRMSITGQLASLFTTEYGNYPTISLDAGVPQRLSMSDLAPYFNPNNLEFTGSMTKAQYLQQNKLPEGFYSFCFQAIEVNTNKVVSESTCSNVWISLSDPPLLNTPANASPITKSDPINILFNWTPRHLNSPNGAFNTDYEFQIKEIWDNAIDPQAAFQTAIPLYTTTTQATTLLYGPTQPVLIAGKRYAWRVKAKARNFADDRDDFKNNGYSDVFWFDYKTACPVPIGYSINKIDPSTVSLGWVNGLNITDYVVEYRQINPALSPWVKTPLINTNPLILNNLVPSSIYEVKVASNCPGNILEYGITQVFTTPIVATNTTLVGNDVIKVKGKVSWAYYNKGELASTDNNPLVVTNAVGSVNNCNIPKDEQVVTKYNLPNAIVVVYKITEGNKQEIGRGYSDAFGNYSINVPSNLAKTETSTPINIYYIIEVQPAKSFATIVGKLLTTKQTTLKYYKYWLGIKSPFPSYTYTTTLDAANSYEVTSFVKNFEYEPKITSNDMATAQQSSMSVDILLSKSDWDNSYSKLPINIGKTVKGNTTYNNQNYVILENITKGNVYKQLMQGYSYVAKINCQNGTSTYSVFNSPTDYCKLSECYNYPFFTKLTGVVTGGGITRNNATVSVTIKDADRIGKTSSTTTNTILTIRTNANGEYSFDSIPKLKPNSDVKIEVKDATIRKDAFLFTTKLSSSTDNSYNINLVNELYTIVGYLTDQYKNPIANALIEYDGNVLPNRTGKDGYYLLQVDSKTKSITFSANGFTTLSFTPANLGVSLTGQFWDLSTRTNNLEAFWSSIMEQISGRKYPNFNSENFGYPSGDLKSLFTKLNSKATDKLVGVYDLDSKVMTNNNERVSFIIKLKGLPVNTKISFIRVDGINETPIASYSAFNIFNFAAPAGYYKFKIEPVDNNNVFVPFVGEFTSRTVVFETMVTPQFIVVNLTDGALLKGMITNLKTNSILDSTTITADGLPYKDSSNNLGEYKMYLPKNESIKLQIRRKGYNTFDTTVKFTNNQNVIDFKLLQFDKSYTPVYTIAGFKVEIDKQLKDPNPNTYVVSGKLTLEDNDIFKTVKDFEKLTFKNISVVVDPSTNDALPVVDILFEEAVIQSNAFGYPVEVEGLPQIKLASLRTATSNYYSPAVIGGSQIVTKLASFGSIIKFRDAILRDADVVQNSGAFNYVYITPKTKINALSDSKSYKVEFIEKNFEYTKNIYLQRNKNTTTPDSNYLQAQIIPNVCLYIDKFNSTLSKDGLGMKGYFQVPKQLASKIDSSGKIQFEKFTLDRDFKVGEITFAIGQKKPFFMQLQKTTVKLTSLSLYGLGTVNAGVGFGGEVWLKQKPRTDTSKTDILVINKLELVNKSQGLTFSGSLSLPVNGISVKSLVFKNNPNSPTALDMSYNFAEQSFKLSASGILDYKGRDTSTNKIIKTVFPIGIQSFMLDTKTWGVFMKANANVQFNFKVMKINVTNLLVNIGYSMSLSDMNKFLRDSTVTQAPNGAADEAIDEAQTNWAIGISGGIEFPIKQMKVAVKGTVLFGNINNKIQAAVNEIELNINSDSAFTLKAKVGMTFDDTKQGFEADGEFRSLGKGFAAGFKYYAYSNGTFELGAKLKASLGPTGVTTGPINWFSIGGGFNCNTNTQVYEVFFSGEVSTAGTPKDAAYLNIERIGLLFDLGKCPGGQPVFDGSAELFIKNESWGKLTTKFDFCKMTMLITVNGSVPLVKGLSKIPVSGIVYGLAPQGGKDGAFFMSVNASLSGVFNSYVNGNAFIALGINYNNNHPLAPQEIKNIWNDISYNAKDNSGTVLNGIYLSANMSVPNKNGSFGVSIAGFKVFNVTYDVNASGSFKLYYKFSNNNLLANATVTANASGSMTILGFSLYGSAYVNGTVNGGYDNSWYLNGDLAMGFQVYNRESAPCNKISFPDACTVVYYPCGHWYCLGICTWCDSGERLCVPDLTNPSFKACFSAKLAFSFRQGQTPSISLKF